MTEVHRMKDELIALIKWQHSAGIVAEDDAQREITILENETQDMIEFEHACRFSPPDKC